MIYCTNSQTLLPEFMRDCNTFIGLCIINNKNSIDFGDVWRMVFQLDAAYVNQKQKEEPFIDCEVFHSAREDITLRIVKTK